MSTTTVDRPIADDEEIPRWDGREEPHVGGGEDADVAQDELDAPVRVPLVAAAAALSTLAGVWMVTRLFRGGVTPVALGVVGAGVGVGMAAASYRMRRPATLQYLVLPATLALGAVLGTAGSNRSGSLPSLVADAVRGGGLSQPPIPFEPGWRFLIVVLFALIGASACAVAVSLGRPKLAVALPLPVTLGAALLQPQGSEVAASGVAIVFVVAGLALAYGADLASEGVVGSRFEVRRLVRGAGLLAVVVVALSALAQTDLLFPATDQDEVIPPQRPPSPPPEKDRVLFTVESERPGPWRVGVLDVYDDGAFLLPSIDPSRVNEVPSSGELSAGPGTQTYEARFNLIDVKGQTLPGLPNPIAIQDLDDDAEYDPRTQVVKLVDRVVPSGLEYTMVAPVPPDGPTLAAAPLPDPMVVGEFAAAPPPPPEVEALLASAPTTNQFDRLQHVRQALYGKVVAAGAGKPVDIAPVKVVAMLEGGEATPYEIVAAETLLARWAGVPARIGFGFFGGEATDPGKRAFRPKHGAAFLEAYFQGQGWVPILGTPPQAKASLSDEEKNDDPKVVPTDELGLVVFVPVEFQSIQQLYELVRYWATIVLPLLAGLLVVAAGYTAVLKMLRTGRRNHWAAQRGPAARVAVAYVELRDRAFDLNIGDGRSSPLEFLADVADDDEHAELAWLVTRALWGDLTRDLRQDDVGAAEKLARSVTRRLLQEETAVNRLAGRIARSSLRDPWSDEVPNLWRARRPPRQRRSRTANLRVRLRSLVRVRRRLAPAGLAVVLPMLLLLGSCGGGSGGVVATATYPEPLVPDAALGYGVVREEAIEDEYQAAGDKAIISEGQVFTIRGEDAIQGSFQVALFKPGIDGDDPDVQEGIERGLGAAQGFTSARLGVVRLRTLELTEQRMFLWFPPRTNVMQLWVMRKDFADAEGVVRTMIAHQRGLDLTAPNPGGTS